MESDMSGLTWAHTTRTRDARGGKTLHSATPIAQLASAAGPQRGSHGGCAHPQPRQAATRRRYIRRTKDQGPRQETASDVGDRHLDERELELQPLAGRHEELGAAILGRDLHAWLGLGLRSGLGLGISTPARCGGDTGGAEAAQRRRRGAQLCGAAVWCRGAELQVLGAAAQSQAAGHCRRGQPRRCCRWLAALLWSMRRHPYRRRPC